MREWLSGGVSPCQGEGRGFESRLALFAILLGFTRVFDGLTVIKNPCLFYFFLTYFLTKFTVTIYNV